MGEAQRKPIESPANQQVDEHQQKYTSQTPLEEGRRRQGGFTGSTTELLAQLRKEMALDQQTRATKPEPEIPEVIEISDEDVVDEAKEWHKRGYIASDEEALPPAIPDESALPNAQRYLKLDKQTEELVEARKKIGRPLILNPELQKLLLLVIEQERKVKKEMDKLEAYFRRNGVKIVQLEGIVRRAKKQAAPVETEKVAEEVKKEKITSPAETRRFQPHPVYYRKVGGNSGPIGGYGTGNLAEVIGHKSGASISDVNRRTSEDSTERTNEEAIFDLDQELINSNRDVKFFGQDKNWAEKDLTKEIAPEKLLQKLFHSEIYLDKEEHTAAILADKTFLQALDIEKWNGDLSVLKEVVGRLSLEKFDELTAIKHNKPWFKRLFKSPEEKLFETQMEALDDLAGKLIAGGKETPASPEAKRLLRAMTKR